MDRAGDRRGADLSDLPAGPRRRRVHVPAWPGAVLLAVLTWPVATVTPARGLDPSWQIGLHLAATRHLRFGAELLFTYGPLGFLSVPRDVSRTTALLALGFTALLQVALLWTATAVLRPHLTLPGALLAAYLLGSVVRVEAAEVLTDVAAVWALLHVRGRWPDRLDRRAPEIAGAVAGAALLIKFNTGLTVALLAGGAVLLGPVMRRSAIPRLLGAGASSFLLLWVATGQRLGDIASYLRGSLDVAGGYTGAMHGEVPGLSWQYGAAAVIGPLLVLLAALSARGRARFAAAVLTAGFLLLRFKHGFVRHDAHAAGFFLACAILPLGLLPPSWRSATPGVARTRTRRLRIGGTVVAGLVGVVSGGLVVGSLATLAPGDLASTAPPRRAAAQVREVLDADGAARERVREDLGIPDAMLALLRAGGTVHVDPWEASAVWAYDLPWRPVPVFQAYSAYTPALDDRNAAVLSSADGPTWVLRELPGRSVDRRVPSFESPAAALARLCHFREVTRSEEWQLLLRVPSRCGSEVAVGSRRVEPGAAVAVPLPSAPDRLVVARLQLRPTRAERLIEILHKPPVTRVSLDGVEWRLVPATAGQPLVLRVPDGERVLPGLPVHADVDVLSVPTAERAYVVTFSELVLRPA